MRSPRHQRLIECLVRYREAAGLKQAEVAARLGRHQPFISNLESGERRLDVIELLALAEAIGFDPHQLIDELLKVPTD